jgi:hypothetical protein
VRVEWEREGRKKSSFSIWHSHCFYFDPLLSDSVNYVQGLHRYVRLALIGQPIFVKNIRTMKKSLFVLCAGLVLLSSCELEYRGDTRYTHFRGYEGRHYPGHHDVYNHGYHHDDRGGENHDRH